LALGPLPAWLWSPDASRVLWANPTAAAIFGAPSPAALASRSFDGGQPSAAQVAQLAQALPADGAARGGELRGFGAGIGRTPPGSGRPRGPASGALAVRIEAPHPMVPDLPLKERIARLFAGSSEPLAAFAADGALVHATATARAHLRERT